MNIKQNYLIVPITSSLIIGFIVLYFYNFHDNLSNNSADWSNFSTFISLGVTIANLIVFIFFTIKIQEYNANRDKAVDIAMAEQQKRDEIVNKPILVFAKLDNPNYYNVQNLGVGPALNVLISSNIKNDEWEKHFIYYSIPKDGKIGLKFSSGSNALLAEYTDILGVKYHSFMVNDHQYIFDKRNQEYIIEHKQYFDQVNLKKPDPQVAGSNSNIFFF